MHSVPNLERMWFTTTTSNEVQPRMQLKTILNHVQKHSSFVYGEIHRRPRGRRGAPRDFRAVAPSALGSGDIGIEAERVRSGRELPGSLAQPSWARALFQLYHSTLLRIISRKFLAMGTRTRPRCGLGQAAYPFGVQGEFMLGAEIVQWVASRAQ